MDPIVLFCMENVGLGSGIKVSLAKSGPFS